MAVIRETHSINFRIDELLFNRFKAQTVWQETTMSDVLRQLIEAWLEKQEVPNE